MPGFTSEAEGRVGLCRCWGRNQAWPSPPCFVSHNGQVVSWWREISPFGRMEPWQPLAGTHWATPRWPSNSPASLHAAESENPMWLPCPTVHACGHPKEPRCPRWSVVLYGTHACTYGWTQDDGITSSRLAHATTCCSGAGVASRMLQCSYVIPCLHSFMQLLAEASKLQRSAEAHLEEVSLSKLQHAERVSGSWEQRVTPATAMPPQQAVAHGRQSWLPHRDHWHPQRRCEPGPWAVRSRRDEGWRGAAGGVPPPKAGLGTGTPTHPRLWLQAQWVARGRWCWSGSFRPISALTLAAQSSNSILQLQYDSS